MWWGVLDMIFRCSDNSTLSTLAGENTELVDGTEDFDLVGCLPDEFDLVVREDAISWRSGWDLKPIHGRVLKVILLETEIEECRERG